MEIKPCIFCGNEEPLVSREGIREGFFSVECENCKAAGPKHAMEQVAIVRWNRAWENKESECKNER